MTEVLTREVMGAVALGVLWLNTLLVGAAALSRARQLAHRRKRLRPLQLPAEGSLTPTSPGAYGVVQASSRGDGELADVTITQVGRFAAGRKRAILWHDRATASTITGGLVQAAGRPIELGRAEGDAAETWVSPEQLAEAAACPDAASFDAAYPDARKARGFVRKVKAGVRGGQPLWIAGVPSVKQGAGGETLVLGPGGADRPLVVSTVDPRVWLERRIAMLFAFAPAVVVGAALVTAVALWPPVFEGAVSKAGALLCFVYFLLVLPAGTRARDASIEPPRRALRGRWNDPEGRPDVAPSKAASAPAAGGSAAD